MIRMDETPRYSVIIPVYNAGETLEQCVQSLLGQHYIDAEIILVNDGSTDNSGQLSEKYAACSQQVVYIEKVNGGVSSARNAGLEIASGKYIVFVDSDDTVENDYFKRLDAIDSDGKYDFAWFSFKTIAVNKESLCYLEPHIAENKSECAAMFSKALYSKTINSPWNKRYKNSIIQENAIRFPENLSIGEDTVFNLQYAMQCDNCKISEDVLYAVNVQNQQSLSRKVRNDFSTQFQILDDEIIKTVQGAKLTEQDRKYYIEAINFVKLRSVYSEAKRMHLADKDRRFRRNVIRNMCKENNRDKLPLPGGMFSKLLQIPVRLELVTVIDLMGWYLAR